MSPAIFRPGRLSLVNILYRFIFQSLTVGTIVRKRSHGASSIHKIISTLLQRGNGNEGMVVKECVCGVMYSEVRLPRVVSRPVSHAVGSRLAWAGHSHLNASKLRV
jgi:hypothetical protein